MEHPVPIRPDDPHQTNDAATDQNPARFEDLRQGHKRNLSGSLLSKLPFLRPSNDENATPTERGPYSPEFTPGDDRISSKKPGRAMAVVQQQQKTRRRKGSLRKAALLGRGAQREKKEDKASSLEAGAHLGFGRDGALDTKPDSEPAAFGLGIIEPTPRPAMDGYPGRGNPLLSPIKTLPMGLDDHIVTSPTQATSPTLTYTSTTDEDDVLSIPTHIPVLRGGPQTSSGSDTYFPMSAGSLARRRSAKTAKSPLSLGGLAASPLPVPDAEWDYSETEWWGWVILVITWIVFVTGMGSCLGVWSWAWDVGETPYAPPELEDDATLPIVGYYPAADHLDRHHGVDMGRRCLGGHEILPACEDQWRLNAYIVPCLATHLELSKIIPYQFGASNPRNKPPPYFI